MPACRAGFKGVGGGRGGGSLKHVAGDGGPAGIQLVSVITRRGISVDLVLSLQCLLALARGGGGQVHAPHCRRMACIHLQTAVGGEGAGVAQGCNRFRLRSHSEPFCFCCGEERQRGPGTSLSCCCCCRNAPSDRSLQQVELGWVGGPCLSQSVC
jgi:hypothetical protein